MHLYKVSDLFTEVVLLHLQVLGPVQISHTGNSRAVLVMGPQSQTKAVEAALVMRTKKPLEDFKAGEETSWPDPSLFS